MSVLHSPAVYDKDCITWFRLKMFDRVGEAAIYSASSLFVILIIAVFLAGFSVNRSAVSIIGTLYPLNNPFLLVTVSLFIFLGVTCIAFSIGYLYYCENIYRLMQVDKKLWLKKKIYAIGVIWFIKCSTNYLLCKIFFDDSTNLSSLFATFSLGSFITTCYAVLYRWNYVLIPENDFDTIYPTLNFNLLNPLRAITQFEKHNIYENLQKTLNICLIIHFLQNIAIQFLGYLPLMFSFSSNLDTQMRIIVINFAYIFVVTYIHAFAPQFLLRPFTFCFPDRYEIVSPTIEQKVNIRAVLHTSDAYLKMFAFRDLAFLCRSEAQYRRKHVFDLSIPGDNPLNWHSVRLACLNQISSIMSELDAARQRICDNFHHDDEDDTFNQSMLMMNPTQRMQMYSMSVRRRHQGSLRRKPTTVLVDSSVMTMTIIPEYEKKSLSLAVDAIIDLLIHSLEEDQFGITQKDAGVVIRTLLCFSDTIDKYCREKKAILSDDGIDMKWIEEIEYQINRCVCSFHSSFKTAIDSFNFSPEEYRLYTHNAIRRFRND